MVDQLVIDAEQRLGELAERFTRWRASKTRRGDPIPEPLWAEALALSEVLPRRQICRSLRLSDQDVKKRLGIAVNTPKACASTRAPIPFIEMTEAVSQYTSESVKVAEVAFERPDGARLQVRYAGAVAELVPLVHSFLTAR